MAGLSLVELETYLHLNQHRDWLSIAHRRGKSPLLDRPRRLVIESIAYWLDNLDLAHTATLIQFQRNYGCARELLSPRALAEFRVDLMQDPGNIHTFGNSEYRVSGRTGIDRLVVDSGFSISRIPALEDEPPVLVFDSDHVI